MAGINCGKGYQDIGTLYVRHSELLKKENHIQNLYGLLSKTIERLVAIGSADPIRPNLLGVSGRLQIEAP